MSLQDGEKQNAFSIWGEPRPTFNNMFCFFWKEKKNNLLTHFFFVYPTTEYFENLRFVLCFMPVSKC